MAYKIPELVYPKEAFVAGAFILDEKRKVRTIYPFDLTYDSLEAVSSQFRNAHEFNKSLNQGWSIHEISIVVPITFQKLIPLKPEYWQSPIAAYDDYHRTALFNQALTALPLFKLLVTPIFNVHEKLWHFNAAAPFKMTAKNSEIESFMLNSDYPVDERAEYAAIYAFGNPIRYNWKKRKILRKKFRNLATKN